MSESNTAPFCMQKDSNPEQDIYRSSYPNRDLRLRLWAREKQRLKKWKVSQNKIQQNVLKKEKKNILKLSGE